MTAIRLVLGIDQATRSGWGLALPWGAVMPHSDTFLAHGLASNAAQRKVVLELAVAKLVALLGSVRSTAQALDALLVVLEDHSKMPIHRKAQWSRDAVTGDVKRPERSTGTLLTMGGSRDRWLEQLELLGHPKRNVLLVEPRVWRKAVLGTSINLTTDAWKAQAVMWVKAASGDPTITDHNEAEGMCLTAWGAMAGVQRLARSA